LVISDKPLREYKLYKRGCKKSADRKKEKKALKTLWLQSFKEVLIKVRKTQK